MFGRSAASMIGTFAAGGRSSLKPVTENVS